MPVRICSQVVNTFKVNAPIKEYPIVPELTVGSGDLLYFTTIDNVEYVTNVPNGSNVGAIAINTKTYPENVSVYSLFLGVRYNELEQYPYVVLGQFTCDELSRLNISDHLSTKAEDINKVSAELLNEYSVENLQKFGVRKS